MKQKKNMFGFSATRKASASTSHDWFDPSTFLVKGSEVLPDENEEKPRFFWGRWILVLLIVVLGYRLTHLQIIEGNQNSYLAQGNRIRQQVSIAPRGIITDRKGQPLVTNQPGYELQIFPADLPRATADRKAIFETVAAEVKMSADDITKKVQAAGYSSLDPVSLKGSLSRDEALAYKLKLGTLSGVRVSYIPTRSYDNTPGLGHILGYVSQMTDKDIQKHPDYNRSSPIGRAGLESSYDVDLRGIVGINEVEVNAQGRLQRTLSTKPPQVGSTLQLTLDKGLQNEMAVALQEAMQKNGAKQAVGIAMDPRTGGILASVSLPSYDNNLFAKGISTADYKTLSENPDKPLLNRAVDGLYPPGSTVKPFVSAAALQEKTITADTRMDTSIGVIKIGQWEFPDWKVHGVTDVKQAIAESNDIFFYALGGGWDKIPGLGVDRLKKYLGMFGFGANTNVDYAPDKKGVIPDPDWKKRTIKESWYIGDTYHMSIGQGYFLSTPLQLARATSAIANGGTLYTPHVVDGTITAPSTDLVPMPFPSEKLPLDPAVIKTVQEGMRQTVAGSTGSARSLQALPFTSAGKTGTAQFGTEEKTHAWYIGYAPYENPEIVVTILVEGGGEGNAISVPVASRVFSYYMGHK